MPQILYVFQASGQDTVRAAFKSATQGALEYAKAVERGNQSAGRAPRRGAPTDTQRLAMKVAADQGKAAKSAADAEIREAKRSASAQESALRHVGSIREKYFRDEQRLRERADRANAASAKLQAKANENAQRDRMSSLSSMGGRVGSFVGGAAIGAAVSAAAVLAGAARDSLRVQDIAGRLSINSRGAGQRFVDPTVLRKEFEAASVPGVSAASIAEGASAYVGKTGDLATARANAKTFATVASASGADVRDVYSTAADLGEKFDVKNLDEMKEALAALTFQGKAGAFELKDASRTMGELSAAAGAFGIGKGVQAVKTLGGLAQIARRASGSAEEAATSVQSMFTELQSKGGSLKAKHGVSVYKDGKARDITDIITDSIVKIGGTDITKKMSGLTEVFGIRGMRAINPLVSAANEASLGAGPNATAAEREAAMRAAVTKMLRDNIDAGGDWTEVQKDAAQAQKATSARLEQAWQDIVTATGPLLDAVLPGAVEGITALTKVSLELVNALGPIIAALKPKDEQQHGAAGAALTGEAAKKRAEAAAIDTSTPEGRTKKAMLEGQADSLDAKAKVQGTLATGKAGKVFGKDRDRLNFMAEFKRRGGGGLWQTLLSGAAANVGEDWAGNDTLHNVRKYLVDTYASPEQKAMADQYGIQNASAATSPGGLAAPIHGGGDAQTMSALVQAIMGAVQASAKKVDLGDGVSVSGGGALDAAADKLASAITSRLGPQYSVT